MNVRLYEQGTDYPIVKNWWEENGMVAMPEHLLKATGYISHEGDKDIAAAWLYMDYSVSVAWCNLFISNPEASPKQIHQAHQDIVECFQIFAESEGFSVMMAFYEKPSLVKVAKRSGFMVNHQSVTEMFKPLTPQPQEMPCLL